MNFACIHDCSVCPFYGHDVSTKVYQQIENSVLPKALTRSETVKEPETEKENITEEITEKNENLPVLNEVQYTVTDEKKKLFNWRKK